MDTLQFVGQSPLVALPVALLLGLIVGSFLNVVIYRLPQRMIRELAAACEEKNNPDAEQPSNKWFGLHYLITPASTCPGCGHKIKSWENIPVISYALQKGRCTACNTHISLQYPIVEIASGLLSVIVVYQLGVGWPALFALLLTWALLALSVIDIEHQLLPDVLVLPMLWLGLLINMNGTFVDIESALYGAVAGYLSLWLIFHFFLLFTGKEGMGYGDFKLFALFGAWFGWQLLPQILLVSSVVGAVVGIGLIVIKGRDHNLPIPFGPYLAAAGWIALLWGEEINHQYLQIANF